MGLLHSLSIVKPRIVALNLLAALAGSVLASGGAVPWGRAAVLLVLGGLVAAGCGTIGSYADRGIDGLMERTRRRPLPSGRIQPWKALSVGLLMIATGLILSSIFLNHPTTALMALGTGVFILYAFLLKMKTPWSVVIGGVSGSCSLLAGGAAVGGSLLQPPLSLMALLIFLWTPGHFWSLAIWIEKDYARAGVPTLPAIYGVQRSARLAALSNLLPLPLSVAPYLGRDLGQIYLVAALIAGAAVLLENLRLSSDPSPERARRVFKLSGLYLAVLFLAAVLDVAI
ncbi:MAG: heme o synthase [Candidatus Hydrothermarchaeota archaeon]